MRLLICGDRDWTDREMIRSKLARFKSFNGPDHEVIHGACRGADQMADVAARALGFGATPFPADWKRHGRRAGPIRNREMLAYGPGLVWAFHDNLQASKGTKDMVQAARAAGVKVVHFIHEIEYSAAPAWPGRACNGVPSGWCDWPECEKACAFLREAT